MKEDRRWYWSLAAGGFGLLVVLACLFAFITETCTDKTGRGPLLICPPTQVPTAITAITDYPGGTITTAPSMTDDPYSIETPTNTPGPTTAPNYETPSATNTNVASVTPSSTPVPIDQQAEQAASMIAPTVYERFGVQVNPVGAVGLDAGQVNGTQGDLAGWMAPVLDRYQTYTDGRHLTREVEGVFGIKDPSLRVDTMIVVNRTYKFYSPLPPGKYLFACYAARPRDCIAVSMEGWEYRIRPESIDSVYVDSTSPPSVAYMIGSIHSCFRVARRRICFRIF